MPLCIPKAIAQNFKKAIAEGEFDIGKLYGMSPAERRAYFEQYASKELAAEINGAFEKAITSKQKGALKKWAESMKGAITPTAKKEIYNNLLEKIDSLDQLGVLDATNSDSYLQDLVAERLGVGISAEEVEKISGKAKNLQKLFETPTENGLPPVEYFVARKDMEDYLQSLTPAPIARVVTSTIGRAAMLLSFKSPMVNIIANTDQGIFEAFVRRVAEGTYKGLNGDYAKKYVGTVIDIFKKSGYDVSRMETVAEGQRRVGEDIVHSQGKGPVRAFARFNEDLVFKWMMGAPDVAASAVAFADAANLGSTAIATKNEGLTGKEAQERALAIFKDATAIEPKTIEGEIVRSNAIANAQYATGTHKTNYSDVAMAIRTALNKASGNLRLGDQLMPFVKVPANFIQIGIDAAGVGAFKGAYKLPKAWEEMKAGNGEPMKEVVRLFTRAGFGIALAVILAYMIDPDDFIGDYDSLSGKERDLANIKNGGYNSIKVGSKYISLDYFGPLASAFVGVMYARKYGDSLPDDIYQYVRGAGGQALRTPGLREFADLVSGITTDLQRGSLGDVAKGLSDEMVAYIRARTIPALVNDFAQATDPLQRSTDSGQFSKFKASIPGLRETLPAKIDETSGKQKEGEGFFSTLLFGSRVKTANENKVAQEIIRLSYAGQTPTITSITYSSTRMQDLQTQIGDDKYQEAIQYFGTTYGKKAESAMGTGAYKNGDDEDRKKALDSARDQALDSTLSKYHYKKPPKGK